MTDGQGELFEVPARYCIDTNVINAFLKDSDDEAYSQEMFTEHWRFIESMFNDGAIVAPRQVERELKKAAEHTPAILEWFVRRKGIFRDVQSDEQLACAKRIVNAYPAYGRTENYLGDLEVVTLAHALAVPVISMEKAATATPSVKRPKIPDVCREFEIECLSVPAFFRHAGYRPGGSGTP